MEVITAKIWGDKGASGISRLLGTAKLQSTPGADNPCYATGFSGRTNIVHVHV